MLYYGITIRKQQGRLSSKGSFHTQCQVSLDCHRLYSFSRGICLKWVNCLKYCILVFLLLQFCSSFCLFGLQNPHTVVLTVHTSLTSELNSHWWMRQQAQSELQSTKRAHTTAKASQLSKFIILLIENVWKFVMLIGWWQPPKTCL